MITLKKEDKMFSSLPISAIEESSQEWERTQMQAHDKDAPLPPALPPASESESQMSAVSTADSVPSRRKKLAALASRLDVGAAQELRKIKRTA